MSIIESIPPIVSAIVLAIAYYLGRREGYNSGWNDGYFERERAKRKFEQSRRNPDGTFICGSREKT